MIDVEVRQVDAATVRPLRHAMLRAGRPIEESVYPADDAPDTVHFAAFVNQDVIGVATAFPDSFDGRPAWRLRGMAVRDGRRGIGSILLAEVTAAVLAHGGTFLWCKARTVALPFYLTHDFTTVGEEFLAAHDIPHYVAILKLKSPLIPPLAGS